MKNILVVFTGGTIGSVAANGTIDTDSNTAFRLIQLFQQHAENAGRIHFDTVQPVRILSENMAPPVWRNIIEAIEEVGPERYDGIIVTHGSDTLAYSACALSFYFHKLDKPVLLVASNHPLDHPKANGLENFICAVEFIKQVKRPGVYVPYRNPAQTMQVHAGARLACSPQLSGDFFSVQGKSFMAYENGRFTVLNPLSAETPSRTFSLTAVFSGRIMMVKPYPGSDYSLLQLDRTDAVLHDLYHSGTACASEQWGENYSLPDFIRRCRRENVPVYLAPALQSSDLYQSMRSLSDQGATVVWNMSIEAAYVKLLLAYGNFSDRQAIDNFIAADIAGEHVSVE